MQNGSVHSITRLRINTDGQGVRSVVFMQGCPLDCVWCCNPETRLRNRFRVLTPDELYRYIEADVPYFLYSGGGITFSGGEPLQQADFLKGFIEKYCANFSVDMETSLHAENGQLQKLIPLIDTWYVDFKVFDGQLHREYTGISNDQILSNLRCLARHVPKEKIVITYPMIPEHNTAPEQAEQMLAFLKETGIFQIKLHPYRKSAEDKYRRYGLEAPDIHPMNAEQAEKLRTLILNSGFSIIAPQGVYGREKCTFLKRIRQTICAENQLPVPIAECTYEGECIGTCPVCEQELEQIGCYLQMDGGE